MTPGPDLRTRVERATAIIAGDLMRADRRGRLEDAMDILRAYLHENPDATPDDVLAALGPVLGAAVDRYLDHVAGVLAEDVGAAIDGLDR